MNLNLRVLWLWAVRNNSSKTNSREVLPSRHAGGALADEQLLVPSTFADGASFSSCAASDGKLEQEQQQPRSSHPGESAFYTGRAPRGC